ncbi:MAG: hypothetical protein KDE51_16860 [Anaerolineales bacterium]|nr:hypothetical protein [Anaerolineales bacterium]
MSKKVSIEEAGKDYFFTLKGEIVEFLIDGTWSDIEETFALVGLGWRADLNPGWGKPRYVNRVLAELSEEEIVNLAKRCIAKSPRSAVYKMQESLWWYESSGQSQISNVTRNQLLSVLDNYRLHPTSQLNEFLKTFPQFEQIDSKYPKLFYFVNGSLMYEPDAYWEDSTSYLEILHSHLLKEFGFTEWSDPVLFEFLEKIVHPEVRQENEQRELVEALNENLRRDGFNLRCTDFISGHGVFTVENIGVGLGENPKHLIFASNGPKPEIGFQDAVSNKIVILKYEEFCLVYDRPINRNTGLSWEELVRWWEQSVYFRQDDIGNPRQSLGNRLLESLQDSPPEKHLFTAYFRVLRSIYRAKLPALIPQVYVHYDPMTVSMLVDRGDKKRFEKQRMDFLLLLPQGARVILEIDGSQHYSENGKPSPKIYAETVRSDRELRLLGYDVYRFAGIELNSEKKAQRVAENFFEQLFQKYGVTS